MATRRILRTQKRLSVSLTLSLRMLVSLKQSMKLLLVNIAGWYTVKQGSENKAVFCPKYIFIQRYEFTGPYKTETEVKNVLNSI